MLARCTLALCQFAFCLLAFAPAAIALPSTVKCRPARSAVDRMICASPEYLAIEREISALVDLGAVRLALAPEERRRLFESQAAYLRRRDSCDWASHHSAHPGAAVDECVRASMEARVRALRDVTDRSASEAR